MADDTDFKGYFAGLAPAQNTSDNGDFSGYFAGMAPTASSGAAVTPDSPGIRDLKVAGNAAAQGVQNLIGLPGTLAAASAVQDAEFKPQGAIQSGLAAAHNALSAPFRALPTGDQISAVTGLGDANKALQPQTAGERYLAAGAAALPDAALVALTGGGVLPALATTEAGAMSSQAIKEAMPGSKIAPIVAGIVGSLGAQGATGWLQASRAAKQAVENLSSKEQALSAAKSTFSDVLNDSAQARDVATAKLAELKSASSARLDSVKNFVSNMIDHVDSTANGTLDWVAGKLGSAQTAEQVGRTAQGEMRDWVQKALPAQEADLIAPVNAVMEGETVPMAGLHAVLGELPKAKLASLKSNLPPDLLEALNESMESGTPMTWGDARRLRSEIGAMGQSNKIANDIGDKRLDALYAATTGDLGGAANAAGVGEQFQKYNTEMTRLYNFRDNVANKFIQSTNPNAESVLPGAAANGFLSRAGTEGTEIAAMRAQTPKVADELAAFAVRDGQWGELSPEARAALVPDDGVRGALDTATGAAAQAKANGKSIIDQATNEHKDLIAAANSDRLKEILAQRASSRTAKQGVANAMADVAAARAAIPAKPNQLTSLLHLARGTLAGEIGANALNAIGNVSPAARAAIMTGSYLIPAAYRGAKSLVSNPRNALAAALGAGEGAQANQLAGK